MYNLDELLRQDDARATLRAATMAPTDVEPAPAAFLRSLKLKIISNCNLRCEMCKYWQIAKQQLSRDVIHSVLDHAASLGCLKVHLSGGEVTLHHDLVDAIRRGADHGMRMNLTSNGLLMDKARARSWIDAGLRSASFSLDGSRAKTHDAIRGVPGAFKRTVRAIKIVVREIERRDARLRVRINNVLSAKNLEQLPDLVRMAGELGVVDVLPMPIDGKRALRPSAEQIEHFNREIVPQVAELRRRYGMPIDAGRLYPFGRSNHDVQCSAEGRYGLGHYDEHLCYAPYLHAFVSHTGDVFACCMTRDRMRSLGNVREQNLTEIFEGTLYEQFRHGMLRRRLPICSNCDQYLRENRLVDARLVQIDAPQLAPLGRN